MHGRLIFSKIKSNPKPTAPRAWGVLPAKEASQSETDSDDGIAVIDGDEVSDDDWGDGRKGLAAGRNFGGGSWTDGGAVQHLHLKEDGRDGHL